MFPDEEAVEKWFESVLWPVERCCGHCGSVKTNETPKRYPQPYWCSDCRRYFSVRTGTALARSHVSLKKWAYAVFLYVTNLKGISSTKLRRDIGVTQSTAWFMLRRLRQSGEKSDTETLFGPVEIDETNTGGRRRNMSKKRRAKFSGRGASDKTAVVGMKDRPTDQIRARVIPNTKKGTLALFILESAALGVKSITGSASTNASDEMDSPDSRSTKSSPWLIWTRHTGYSGSENGTVPFSLAQRRHRRLPVGYSRHPSTAHPEAAI